MMCLFLQELLQLEDRLGNVNRGAVQTTIERFTFPHKYKKVSLATLYLYILIIKQYFTIVFNVILGKYQTNVKKYNA